MAEPHETPACAACGLVLTPEDVAKADQHLLCADCSSDLPLPAWWRGRQAAEGREGEAADV